MKHIQQTGTGEGNAPRVDSPYTNSYLKALANYSDGKASIADIDSLLDVEYKAPKPDPEFITELKQRRASCEA